MSELSCRVTTFLSAVARNVDAKEAVSGTRTLIDQLLETVLFQSQELDQLKAELESLKAELGRLRRNSERQTR